MPPCRKRRHGLKSYSAKRGRYTSSLYRIRTKPFVQKRRKLFKKNRKVRTHKNHSNSGNFYRRTQNTIFFKGPELYNLIMFNNILKTNTITHTLKLKKVLKSCFIKQYC